MAQFWIIDEFNDMFQLGTLAGDVVRSLVNGFRLKPYHRKIPPNPLWGNNTTPTNPRQETWQVHRLNPDDGITYSSKMYIGKKKKK